MIVQMKDKLFHFKHEKTERKFQLGFILNLYLEFLSRLLNCISLSFHAY